LLLIDWLLVLLRKVPLLLLKVFELPHRVMIQILASQFLIKPILLKVTICEETHRKRTYHRILAQILGHVFLVLDYPPTQVPGQRETEHENAPTESVKHARTVIVNLVVVVGDEGGVVFESLGAEGDTFSG